MIQNLRQIKNRIKSITNTKKITRAMQMVSAAKLNRVRATFHDAKPYLTDLQVLLEHMLQDADDFRHPLLEKHHDIPRAALCVIASDTGLCGTYNQNVFRQAEHFLAGKERKNVDLVIIGKEAFGHFR
ncbi:MAG: F0F1 ATP synthase subunit gamma, partial [Candidatus Omnitrophica bacterium]|nr:F0F1 ATP synthase subunit gamma [Candidatus Omnitrophota bacterium]